MSGIPEFLKARRIAVVGATPNTHKWGNRVLRCLVKHGYEVIPVHRNAPEVEGIPAYPTVLEIPAPVDAVSLIVPPNESEQVVAECLEKGIGRVWFQPGAESGRAVATLEEAGVSPILNACVLVELGC